jgi:MFS family permease
MEAANIASPLLTSSIQYVVNVVLTLPAILFLDRWGRRPSLLLGAFFMMLFLFLSGALQAVYGEPNTPAMRAADQRTKDITWIVRDNRRKSLCKDISHSTPSSV